MSLSWHHIPALRLLIPLIAGIIVSKYFPVANDLWGYIAFFTMIVLSGLGIKHKKFLYRMQTWIGLALQLSVFACGHQIGLSVDPGRDQNYFMHDAGETDLFICRITQPPGASEKTFKLPVEIHYRIQNNKRHEATGNSIIYIRKDSLVQCPFSYGDIIVLKNIFDVPKPAANPGDFDYAKYLQQLGIFHIAFGTASDLVATGDNSGRPLWTMLFNARAYFHGVLEQYITDPDNKAVGEALVIGTRTDISDEMRDAYAHTGTMHVLAVSGLHVGILFMVLQYLLYPVVWLRSNKTGRIIQCILLLIIIWWYACLAGLSPSINRAALTFSLLAVGKLFERNIQSFNIVFISMILLVLQDPRCIAQAGFQLSYLAVAGIIYFQPYFESLWKPRFAVVKYILALITVSMAAQIATAPLSVYLFHQFPNYFLLSNILAIPISFVVLVSGLLLFATGMIPIIAKPVAFVFDTGLSWMNTAVMRVDGLPHAVSEGIWLSAPEMLVCYGLIGGMAALLFFKNHIWLRVTLVLLFVFIAAVMLRKMQQDSVERILCYAVKGSEVLTFQSNGTLHVLSDSLKSWESDSFRASRLRDPLMADVKTENLYAMDDMRRVVSAGFVYQFPWLIAKDQVIFFVDPVTVRSLPVVSPEVEILYFLHDPFVHFSTLRKKFPNASVVIGNTCGYRKTNFYIRAGEQAGFDVHAINRDGAFIRQ